MARSRRCIKCSVADAIAAKHQPDFVSGTMLTGDARAAQSKAPGRGSVRDSLIEMSQEGARGCSLQVGRDCLVDLRNE